MDDDFDFDFEAGLQAKDALRRANLRADGIQPSEGGSATRGRHSQVCRHWLRNLCVKGDRCDYLHRYDPDKMPECIFWLKSGKCSDPNCTFRHVEPSERPECLRFRLGFCKFGPLCRSRHDRFPRSQITEVLPDWYLDSLIYNAHLVPRAEDVKLTVEGRGPNSQTSSLALASELSTEHGIIPGLPPPITGKCRFHMVRSMSVRNIQISAAKGIWATSLSNSQKFRQAFRDVDHVILVFSATEDRCFKGYAKMVSEPDDRLMPGIWGDLSHRLSSNFKVQWIKRCGTDGRMADHITNPQSDHLPVRRCRDGQELPSSVGERLCRFLWQQPEADLLKGSDLEFESQVSCEQPAAIQDVAAPGGSSNAPEPAPKEVAQESAVKKEEVEADDGRSRPAPARIGTFQREASWMDQRNSSAVSVGKALASGSSSLLQAMSEQYPLAGPVLPVSAYGHWPAPSHGWRPVQHAPPHGWGGPPPGTDPSHGQPPPGYFAPQAVGYQPPPPGHPHGMPPPPGHYGQPPPAYGQPPAGWEGASSAPLAGIPSEPKAPKARRSASRGTSRHRRKRRRC